MKILSDLAKNMGLDELSVLERTGAIAFCLCVFGFVAATALLILWIIFVKAPGLYLFVAILAIISYLISKGMEVK